MKSIVPPVKSLVRLWRYEVSVPLVNGTWVSRRVSCVDYDAAMRAARVFQSVVLGAKVGALPRVGVVHGGDNLPMPDGWAK